MEPYWLNKDEIAPKCEQHGHTDLINVCFHTISVSSLCAVRNVSFFIGLLSYVSLDIMHTYLDTMSISGHYADLCKCGHYAYMSKHYANLSA